MDEKSKIFDNSKSSDPVHIAYEEEVDLENSVETSLNQSFTFDTTVDIRDDGERLIRGCQPGRKAIH